MSDLIYLELSGDDYAEIEITPLYTVEPTEYEGSYVFYRGGASFESYTVPPFKYNGKSYKSIPVELFSDIVFNPMYVKETNRDVSGTLAGLTDSDPEVFECCTKEAKQIIYSYIKWLFYAQVAPDISVPAKNYPDSRSL